MSSSIQFPAQNFGTWRAASGFAPLAGGGVSSSAATAAAGDRRGPREAPLMHAMLATMTVTEAGAAEAGTATATAAEAGDTAPPLKPAVVQFSHALMKALHGAAGEDEEAGEAAEAGAEVDRYQGNGPVAERLSKLADQVKAAAAQADQHPAPRIPRAVQRVLEAFTELQQAMSQPVPQGTAAQRQALGEFLDRLAQSFTGNETVAQARGPVVSIKA